MNERTSERNTGCGTPEFSAMGGIGSVMIFARRTNIRQGRGPPLSQADGQIILVTRIERMIYGPWGMIDLNTTTGRLPRSCHFELLPCSQPL
ncbi:hypothetical protein OH76DRAFT_177171 [Lentinus brumalis]|uniref:Uncharacterized protein n=1 Tax=Lentinus brumalis TaxID=2498619 RepID=A0A371CNM4_9APHY|nr:hypothetical protein OH76DRAFT_177171 [Polyporus brumalis]